MIDGFNRTQRADGVLAAGQVPDHDLQAGIGIPSFQSLESGTVAAWPHETADIALAPREERLNDRRADEPAGTSNQNAHCWLACGNWRMISSVIAAIRRMSRYGIGGGASLAMLV